MTLKYLLMTLKIKCSLDNVSQINYLLVNNISSFSENKLPISVHILTCRPKGDHVDVKTVGRDEESGIG